MVTSIFRPLSELGSYIVSSPFNLHPLVPCPQPAVSQMAFLLHAPVMSSAGVVHCIKTLTALWSVQCNL